MSEQNIRWIHRFNDYTKALALLTKFMERETLNELEGKGLVKSFECTYGLPLSYLFDLSFFNNITNPDLVNHIERVGALFYQKQQAS